MHIHTSFCLSNCVLFKTEPLSKRHTALPTSLQRLPEMLPRINHQETGCNGSWDEACWDTASLIHHQRVWRICYSALTNSWRSCLRYGWGPARWNGAMVVAWISAQAHSLGPVGPGVKLKTQGLIYQPDHHGASGLFTSWAFIRRSESSQITNEGATKTFSFAELHEADDRRLSRVLRRLLIH